MYKSIKWISKEGKKNERKRKAVKYIFKYGLNFSFYFYFKQVLLYINNKYGLQNYRNDERRRRRKKNQQRRPAFHTDDTVTMSTRTSTATALTVEITTTTATIEIC